MHEYQEPRIQTKEEFEKMKFQEWLVDSHFWIRVNQTFYCKWCKVPTTTFLEWDAKLCKENPAIKELLSGSKD